LVKHQVGPGSYNPYHDIKRDFNTNRVGFNSSVEREYYEQLVNDVPGPG